MFMYCTYMCSIIVSEWLNDGREIKRGREIKKIDRDRDRARKMKRWILREDKRVSALPDTYTVHVDKIEIV